VDGNKAPFIIVGEKSITISLGYKKTASAESPGGLEETEIWLEVLESKPSASKKKSQEEITNLPSKIPGGKPEFTLRRGGGTEARDPLTSLGNQRPQGPGHHAIQNGTGAGETARCCKRKKTGL